MKIGLLVAAVIVVLRIILEQVGAPDMINNVFGVAWLYLIMPVVFALGIAAANPARPYKALFKNVALFALYTRLMVMVTYMLAYVLRWRSPRFMNVRDDVHFVSGFFLIPIAAGIVWILMATAAGMLIGSIILAWKRKKPVPTPAT